MHNFFSASRIRNRLDDHTRLGRILSPGQSSTGPAALNPDIVDSAQPAGAVMDSVRNQTSAALQVPMPRSLSVTSIATTLPPYSAIAVEESSSPTAADPLEIAMEMLEHLYADAHTEEPMVDPMLCSNGRMYDMLTLRRLAAANGGTLRCPATGEAMTVLAPVERIRKLSHALNPRCEAEYDERRRLQQVVGSPSSVGTAISAQVGASGVPSGSPPAYALSVRAAIPGQVSAPVVPNSPPPAYRSVEGRTSTFSPAQVRVQASPASRAVAPTRRPAVAAPVPRTVTPPLQPLPPLPEPVQFACGSLFMATACAALEYQRQGSQGSEHYKPQRLEMDLFHKVGLVGSSQASAAIAVALKAAGLYNFRLAPNRQPLRRETVRAALGFGQTPDPALRPAGCTLHVADQVADLIFILRQEDTRVLALGETLQATDTLLQEARRATPRDVRYEARLEAHIGKIGDVRQALPNSISPTARMARPLVP